MQVLGVKQAEETEYTKGVFITESDIENLSVGAIGLMAKISLNNKNNNKGDIIYSAEYFNKLEISMPLFKELTAKGYVTMLDVFTYKLVKR